MSEKDLLLPDIGDFKDVEVIELLVAAEVGPTGLRGTFGHAFASVCARVG